MNTPMSIAVFFTMWWIILFAVLPFGVKSQREEGSYFQGTDPGAPVAPHMLKKILWTTAVTIVLFGILYYFTNYAP